MKLRGTITAMITPFCGNKLDHNGLCANIDFQLKNGVDGILVLGTTGESPTLSSDEQEQVITSAVEKAKGKAPVLVGTGSNSTQEAIKKTQRAKDLGADIALIVAPYYNKPTQEGIYRHFEAIANSVDIPIIIYNIPGRCAVNIETPTLLRLASFPNIIGIKECSGNLVQMSEIRHLVTRKHPQFLVYAGDDIMTLPMIALGASGIISVVSNLIPDQIVSLVNASLKGQFDLSREIHQRLIPLFKILFIETNPSPIKTAMEFCGFASGGLRLPLCSMSVENTQLLHQVLKEFQLIKGQEIK